MVSVNLLKSLHYWQFAYDIETESRKEMLNIVYSSYFMKIKLNSKLILIVTHLRKSLSG